MKTVILIGATGKMGQAALKGIGKHKVITASRSGDGCDFKVSSCCAVSSVGQVASVIALSKPQFA